MSILTPVFDPPAPVLEACIASVLGQRSPQWEWCIVDDGSTAPHVRAQLDALAIADQRVRVHRRDRNGGIVAATNDALAMATAPIVTFLDHDDELTDDAVEVLAAAFATDPAAGIVYSDEYLIDERGTSVAVYDKPDFSPERLRGQNYFCHAVALDRRYLQSVGGLSARCDGAQDYDCNLRAVEHFGRAVHVRRRLYRWRAIKGSVAADPEAKPSTLIGAERAVRDHCARTGIDAGITPVSDVAFSFRLHRTPRGAPLVSLLVRLVDDALPPIVGEVLREAQYSNIELVTLADDRPMLDGVDEAAERARGEVIVVIDGDQRLRHGDLLGELLPLAQEGDVAAVGPTLHLPDGRIAASGISFDGGPHPVGWGFPPAAIGAWGALRVTREVSAIPALCFAARRSTFLDLGGLRSAPSSRLAGADYGKRALGAGMRVLVTPSCRVTVFAVEPPEPLSDAGQAAWDARWGEAADDEAFSLFERRTSVSVGAS